MDPLDHAMSQFNLTNADAGRSSTPTIQLDEVDGEANNYEGPSALTYHHEKAEEERKRQKAAKRASKDFVGTLHNMQTLGTKNDTPQPEPDRSHKQTHSDSFVGRRELPRSGSSPGLGADLNISSRGRSLSPNGSIGEDNSRPMSNYARLSHSPARRTAALDRPASTIDLLNIPYSQQMAHQMLAQDNARLQTSVGTNAALLNTKKTLDMYRANVKKTTDSAVQYEFAVFMVHAVQEAASNTTNPSTNNHNSSPHRSETDTESLAHPTTQKLLLKEARTILHRLSDKGYAYAQYYLADGYASGLFTSSQKPDHDKAFSQFLAAGKHGHAEAAYRTALCYEFGWGSRRDPAKAVQFHRQAASRGHPGAAVRLGKACLTGDMGLHGRYREGIKWLKRATESADAQHNSAPYELALLHVDGYGADVFKDETYAAQLFTRAAELGHDLAALRMGEVYEHGLLTCPRDPALSIHFYNSAAQAGVPEAMMALCAWYMVGAEPVLEKDEAEAYEWARRAAQAENLKAEYTMGYFTEMGIGCRRDPLEANVWYVRAAEGGEERAGQRLAIIREAEMGGMGMGGGGGDGGVKGAGGSNGDVGWVNGGGGIVGTKNGRNLLKKKSWWKKDR